jgi:hypothetical protein
VLVPCEDLSLQLLLIDQLHLEVVFHVAVFGTLVFHELHLFLQLFWLVGVDEVLIHLFDAVEHGRLFVDFGKGNL